MNRTQKFALNSTMAAIKQVVAMIIGFIIPRVMLSVYGSEINGLTSSLHQFITYLNLVEAGIGGAAIFSLYKPLANKDTMGVSRVVASARKSYRQAGYLFSTGIMLLAIVYAFLTKTSTLSGGTIFFLTLIFGVNGCVDFFLVSGYRVVLTADQKDYILSAITIVQSLLRTAIVCVCSFFRFNVVLLYAIAALSVLLRAVMIYVYSKKQYPYIDKKAPVDKEALNKRWDVIYQQILGTIQTGAPTVIASIMLDFFQVSVYAVYNMVLNGINGILSIFITGLPAGFGELIAKNETDNLRKTVSEFEVAYYYLLSIIYGITMVMILPFVSLYTEGLTDVNYYRPVLAVVIVLNGLLYNIKTPQSMLVISAGMYKETRWRVTIQGAIILVTGILLGKSFGLAGILVGSCLSNLYRTIDLLHFTPKHITHAKRGKTMRRMVMVCINVLLITLPSFFVSLSVTGYFSWVLYAVCCGVYALGIVTATSFLFDKKECISLIRRFRTTLIKRG